MRKRIAALGLLLAMTALLCVPSALAGNTSAGTGESAPGKDAVALAGPDGETGTSFRPDAEGAVSFPNLEKRIRENSLQLLALEESIRALEELDYEDMKEDLRQSLNQIASGQWMMLSFGQGGTLAYERLEQSYDTVRKQYDAIKDGDMQKDNADIIRQLRELEDQICLAGESLYVTLQSLTLQQTGLERQLAALDRTVAEMELRYELGQISALRLSEVKTGRASLSSGLETLKMNIHTCKLQLQAMIGAELTGELRLGSLPPVTDAELAAMDLEKDLAAAKEKSYTLYSAGLTLEDAQDTWAQQASAGHYSEGSYTYRAARHNWQSAQHTYDNAVQGYELKFRTLYAQVGDYRQVWESAKVSLAGQQAQYAAQELRYQQGTISRNALLASEDELRAAEEKVRSAAGDLFSTYNTYRWAVEHGVLN